MADENFTDNLLRAIYAQLNFQTSLLAAREMYGKGYFELGVLEKATLDQTVGGMVSASFQHLTPESLASHVQHGPMGFRSGQP